MTDYRIENNVAVLALDDGKANVVGYDFIDAVNAALDKSVTEASAIVLAGRPGMFSGGFDLKEIQKGPDAAAALVNKGAHLMLRLFTHPQPVVAAVTGHAIAAGAITLMAADTRWVAEGDFKFGLNETAIGMSLPVFAIQLANARLSKRHLTQAVTQATIYDSSTALDVGYLDGVRPAETLLEDAIAEAARLGEFDTKSYAANKISWRAPYIAAIEASLDMH